MGGSHLSSPERNHLVQNVSQLSIVLDRAKGTLEAARSAAEILEARVEAEFVYDAAKRANRLAKAKQANDDISAAMLRLQADANEAIAASQRRLADEYDAAQERGEVGQEGRPKTVSDGNGFVQATAADLGLSRKEIHDARQLRDAEEAEPGITRKTLDEMVERGQEPSKAALKRELKAKAEVERQANLAKLNPSVRASIEKKDAAKSKSKKPVAEVRDHTLEDRIAELEEALAAADLEIAAKDERIAEFSYMQEFYSDWKTGGMDAVRAAMERSVAYWKEKYHAENREKVAAQRSAKAGWGKAREGGHCADLEISPDVEIGGDGW